MAFELPSIICDVIPLPPGLPPGCTAREATSGNANKYRWHCIATWRRLWKRSLDTETMSQNFKPGDLVQPLSGGQVMSVTRIINERVEVKWMANCNIQVKTFDPDVLKKVEPEHK